MDTSLPHPSVSLLSVCVYTQVSTNGHREQEWVLDPLGGNCPAWVLGLKPWYSARAASDLAHGAMSPAQGWWLFKPDECSGQEGLHWGALPPNAAIAGRWFSLVVSLLLGGLVFPPFLFLGDFLKFHFIALVGFQVRPFSAVFLAL